MCVCWEAVCTCHFALGFHTQKHKHTASPSLLLAPACARVTWGVFVCRFQTFESEEGMTAEQRRALHHYAPGRMGLIGYRSLVRSHRDGRFHCDVQGCRFAHTRAVFLQRHRAVVHHIPSRNARVCDHCGALCLDEEALHRHQQDVDECVVVAAAASAASAAPASASVGSQGRQPSAAVVAVRRELQQLRDEERKHARKENRALWMWRRGERLTPRRSGLVARVRTARDVQRLVAAEVQRMLSVGVGSARTSGRSPAFPRAIFADDEEREAYADIDVS